MSSATYLSWVSVQQVLIKGIYLYYVTPGSSKYGESVITPAWFYDMSQTDYSACGNRKLHLTSGKLGGNPFGAPWEDLESGAWKVAKSSMQYHPNP